MNNNKSVSNSTQQPSAVVSVVTNNSKLVSTGYKHLLVLTKTSTLVNAILTVLVSDNKDRDEAVAKVAKLCKEHNITKNKQGRSVTDKNIRSLMLAMLRDINSKRKGWWSNYKVTETDKVFKLEQI